MASKPSNNSPESLIKSLKRRATSHQFVFWFVLINCAFQAVGAYFTSSLTICLVAALMGVLAAISLALSLNAKRRIEIEELRIKVDELSRGYSIAKPTNQAH